MVKESKELLEKITSPIPRVGLGAVIVNPDGLVLMCRRGGPSNYKGKLHLFGGKLDLGESMRSGIIREIIEETDIDAEREGNFIRMGGVIEEIEPDCSYVEECTKMPRMYHWISTVWVINTQDSYFKNQEPSKHYDVNWYDLSDHKVIADLAPSAIQSLVVSGYLFREFTNKTFKQEKACI